MTILTKLGNLLIRCLVGGRARLVGMPRPSKQTMKSVASTPANGVMLDLKIRELEAYWTETLQTWTDAALLTGAQMLSRGNDPGLDTVFLRPATAVLLLRELQRRWASEAAAVPDDYSSTIAPSLQCQ